MFGLNTVLCASGVAILLFWLIRFRRAAAVAGFFILFSLVTRTLALAYVDLAGPIYATELFDWVGGSQSMPLFALSVVAFIIPLCFVFRPSELYRLLPKNGRIRPLKPKLRQIFLVALCLYIFALYINMLVTGPIPMFNNIDRLEYNITAGPMHRYLMAQWFLISGIMSIMMVLPRLSGNDFDLKFFLAFVALQVYFVLTGNRFSIFYASSSYFLIPVSAVVALSSLGLLKPLKAKRDKFRQYLFSKWSVITGVVIYTCIILAILIHNLMNVRVYDDPIEQFIQRSIVQPVELWWTTWRDLDYWKTSTFEVWRSAFFDPIDSTRNTSIQALMVKNLGVVRAEEIISFGQQYAGGYPEILFELFGIYVAPLIALLFGTIISLLLRFIVVSVAHARALTAVIGIYVFYGMALFYIGGMLNFLLVWTFWVKVVALIAAYLFELRKEHIRGNLLYDRSDTPIKI